MKLVVSVLEFLREEGFSIWCMGYNILVCICKFCYFCYYLV